MHHDRAVEYLDSAFERASYILNITTLLPSQINRSASAWMKIIDCRRGSVLEIRAEIISGSCISAFALAVKF